MIRVVGLGEAGVFVVLCFPIEVSAVDDCSANGYCVTIHVFCCRVGYNIYTPLYGTAVYGGCECIVDDYGHSILVGYAHEFLNIEHVYAGVGDCLAKKGFCVGTEGFLYFFL